MLMIILMICIISRMGGDDNDNNDVNHDDDGDDGDNYRACRLTRRPGNNISLFPSTKSITRHTLPLPRFHR